MRQCHKQIDADKYITDSECGISIIQDPSYGRLRSRVDLKTSLKHYTKDILYVLHHVRNKNRATCCWYVCPRYCR